MESITLTSPQPRPETKIKSGRKKKVSFSPYIIVEHKPITLSFN